MTLTQKLFSNKFICILTIVLLGAICYSFMINGSFKTLDDKYSIVENTTIKDFSNVSQLFKESFFGGNAYYRPLVALSFMTEFHFFAYKAQFYYINNLILHLLCSVMIFLLMERLLKKRNIAFFTSLLFCIHPIHWEAVSNIPGRSILLCALFYISAFYFYVRFHQTKKATNLYFLIACYILAILSKESGVILPGLIVLFLFCQRRRLDKDFFKECLAIGPLFLIGFIYILFRKYLGIDSVFYWNDVRECVLGFITFLRSMITHLRTLFFPIDLHFDRSQEVFTSFANPEVIITIIFFIGLLIAILSKIKKFSNMTLFFLLWFAFEFAPISQILVAVGVQPGRISSADHFLYTPSVAFFALCVTYFANKVSTIIKEKKLTPLTVKLVVTAIFACFFMTTITANIYSSSELAMFKQTMIHDPKNTRIRYSYGLALASIFQFEQAEQEFRAVLETFPSHPRARIALGKSLVDQKKYWQGIQEYESVGEAGRHQELLDHNIEIAYDLLIKKYLKQIQGDSNNADLYYSLGVVYSKVGEVEKAIGRYRQAIEINPQHKNAFFNCASALEAINRKKDAALYYKQALQIVNEPREYDETLLNKVRLLNSELLSTTP